MKRAIDGAWVWDGAGRLVEDGVILIDDGQVEALLPRGEAASRLTAEVQRIDGRGKLAIPGLVNAHSHLYSSLARGMALPGFAPQTFTQILEQLWWRLDKGLDSELVRTSAIVGAMEAARCGVTTLVDHHASPRAIPGSLSAVRDAVCDTVGLRGSFAYEVSDRDGPGAAVAGIEENARFLSGGTSQRSAGLFGLHASFTLSDATLERVADVLPPDAGIHIHVAEGPEDEVACQKEHGLRIVERLDRYHLLRERSVLAHCLHIDEAEKDLIADRGAIVVHNPRSNMNNAVGAFDLGGFLERGILVGLGTDGLGENLLGELFTAGILQKHVSGNPLAGGFPDLERMLFDHNPAIAGRLLGVRSGRIAPGYAADIALFEYEPPTPITAENVLGHLLFGMAVHDLRASDLLVAGRPILETGRFADLDAGEIYTASRATAKRLWETIE
jgi:putative selenium metabolism protein SsnA